MRFSEGKVSAVFDWDSLRIMRGPELVGSVAHFFTADFGVPNQRRFPTLCEALSFASDYEGARGKAFTSDEERAVRAALAYSMAYSARCAHSIRSTEFGRRAPAANESPSVAKAPPAPSSWPTPPSCSAPTFAGLPTIERTGSR
jgi:hypothetical protein